MRLPIVLLSANNYNIKSPEFKGNSSIFMKSYIRKETITLSWIMNQITLVVLGVRVVYSMSLDLYR
jgi:hypothetical protein